MRIGPALYKLDTSASVMGYARNATRNRFVSWLRRRRVVSLDVTAEGGGGEFPWTAQAPCPLQQIAVRDEFAKLSDPQRLALSAVYIEGLTYEEAASATGISFGSLKRYLREGLATMGERLREP